MALDSDSTETTARAQLNNNLDYDGDLTKSALALEAVRWLIFNVPSRVEQDSGREHEFQGWVKLEDSLAGFVARNTNSANMIRLGDIS